VRLAHDHTTWTTSVCTGALILGAAGLLRGIPATTHWTAYDALAGYGAQPTEQRVVIEGKIATAAGVSAGIDLALTLVGRIWGDEIAAKQSNSVSSTTRSRRTTPARRPRHRRRSGIWWLPRSADRSGRSGRNGLRQVGDDLGWVFQTNGYAQQAVGDADRRLFLR